ncbi:PQQ-dependent oxidoreductase gdhB family [Jejuia pallidilutea]|uniref:PQQ-dependent oxidoreductase n=1 Tax=Jejuia pallidilutea TaxID=504487 RepID=A0A090WJ60_9FLAO|nr:PQQ-dependent oxidoreductase gdhB family [Jejuia pallidilutea]GAL71275.1 PQQ-dependent oxidoreductase [Jejuia pallidilutea]
MKQFTLLLAIALISFYSCAQQEPSKVSAETPVKINYVTEVVVPELDIPWGMEFLPDGSMLITEKAGTLIHFKDDKKTIINGLPEVYVRGQGGLMDIKLHPDYKNNGWIYFSYASAEGEDEGGNTAIMRAKLNGNTVTNVEHLYKGVPNTKKGQHWGSRLEFDNEGHLYFSIGDRGNRDVNPQDITKDGGKIYRLHADGSIPEDNPFTDNKNAKQAIFSYGHRNPQGMALHPKTGKIWVNEHGPKGGDEINIVEKGKNYGWPVISYGINYSGTKFTEITEKEGMQQPLFYWVPSIAPSGMAFPTSSNYPDWEGSVLVGSLKFEYLERLVLKNNKVVKREKLFEGLADLEILNKLPTAIYMLP